MPRLMIVTFWTGSHFGSTRWTTAWPPSWYAMISFSASEMTRLLRSGPATMRSRASSKSVIVMTLRLRRAARIAPSFMRFARSAPEKPGDWRAMSSMEIALSSGLPLRVDLQDRDAALHVRAVEDDLAVEPARAQERRVEDVRPVGGGDDDHVRVRVEAVHLDEDLVEGLLALVVAAAEAGAALAPDRVDLVHEHDARRSCAWPGRTGRGRGSRRRRRTSRRTRSRRC